MSLLTSEVQRIKIELGYNGLTLSALPYAFDGITSIFEQILQQYLQAGELNASSTAITASTTPTLATLNLSTTPTAMQVNNRIVVDQGAAQEFAYVKTVVPSTGVITCMLQGAHTGSYPVTVEGSESTVRYYLGQCISIADRIGRAANRAGVKKADEIEFFASKGNQRGVIDDLLHLQRYWRTELATACGVGPQLRPGGGGAYLVSA
jgi:hypothetical protein